MEETWYYVSHGQSLGPVAAEKLHELVAAGTVKADTPVWRHGFADWLPAGQVPGLMPAPPPPPTTPPVPPPPGPQPRRHLVHDIGARISEVTDLPTISDVPVGDIFKAGLSRKTSVNDTERVFIVGTDRTTPELEEIESGWPRPIVFWRILAGGVGAYLLLRLLWTEFGNPLALPGIMVVGSFVIPLGAVVFFFEMNAAHNVSIYQTGKMVLLGGTVSLVVTMVLFRIFSGAGTGDLLPSLLTGVVEETGKGLALLLMVRAGRYRWQTNGILFGAAIGAGFAGFESSGYAFRLVLRAFMKYADAGQNLDVIAGWMMDSITSRGLLSPGGHVIWAAMIGSALWKVKGDQPFKASMLAHPTVIRRWATAVVLHGLWDADLLRFGGQSQVLFDYAKYGLLILVGWYITFAILKEALAEFEGARRMAVTGTLALGGGVSRPAP